MPDVNKNKKPVENGIQLYFHCKDCLSRNQEAKLAVGWTVKGIQVWCENCNKNIAAFDFKGMKVTGDSDPKNK